MTSSDIAGVVNGRLTGEPNLPVSDLLTDSRLLSYTDNPVFFAISGKHHNGHTFIDSLYRRGVRIFVVEALPGPPANYPGASFIEVSHTIDALQVLAAFRRKSVGTKVIAITGSAGKTVVKEWLADIIGQAADVVRSPKSYNSQIGVPLSVWKLDDRYSYGIFEAGISRPGEMDRLQRIIDPEIGIITNIGDAHRENFPDDSAKASEKLTLFRNSQDIIYCRDHIVIHDLITGDKNLGSKNITDWSLKDPEARAFVSLSPLAGFGTGICIKFGDSMNEYRIPFTDRASTENAVTVAAACLHLGIPSDIIAKGLQNLVSVAMRMELKSGINNCQLIEDYYNSDPGSLGMALEYLKSQSGRRATLLLSDFIQSGTSKAELYAGVANMLEKAGVEKFIGIGDSLCDNAGLFRGNARFYRSTDEFISSFNASDFRDEIILLKGARIFQFERIANLLEQQLHQTVLEINLDAIAHNLNEFRRYLDPGTRIMVMVKAFAYGAGPSEIASLLEYHRVSYLAVAYSDEGVELRKAGVTLPVMVMNPDPAAADQLILYDLEPEIFSFSAFESFKSAASRHGLINYPVHIKIDTGMHRLGFLPEEIEQLSGSLRKSNCIRVASVFSHLAASENPALDDFTRKQAELFKSCAGMIQEATGYPLIRHILNSAGIIRWPQYQFEMVRPGIGIYGIGSHEGPELKTTGRFKTRISQVKLVKANEPVGYGCTDVSDSDRMIAILPVGYADGLSRRLGNRNGELFIRGRRVPITGNICMDMCMADVSGLNAAEGDEAEIFGENITIDEMASRCDTIPYEILTSVPERVKRVFYRE